MSVEQIMKTFPPGCPQPTVIDGLSTAWCFSKFDAGTPNDQIVAVRLGDCLSLTAGEVRAFAREALSGPLRIESVEVVKEIKSHPEYLPIPAENFYCRPWARIDCER